MKVWEQQRWVSVLLVISIALLLTASHIIYGVAIGMDSLTYLSVAKQISIGNGVVLPDYISMSQDTVAMTMWPPLYPALLSFFCQDGGCISSGLKYWMIYFNLLMISLACIVFLVVAGRNTDSWVALAAGLAFVLLPATQIIYLYLWSEVVFIPVALLSLCWLDKYFRQQYLFGVGQSRYLVAAIVMIAVATYLRYVGFAYALALVFSVLIFQTGNFFRKIKVACMSGGIFTLLTFPLLARNWFYSGYLSGGERGAPSFRVIEDVNDIFSILIQEIFLSQGGVALVWVLFSAALMLFAYRNFKRQPKSVSEVNFRRLISLKWSMPLLWAAVYLIFILISRSTQNVDLDTRMMAVVLPFILLSMTGVVAFLRARLKLLPALSPLLIITVLAAVEGVLVHKKILLNLSREYIPGSVHHMYYPSINHSNFDVFKNIQIQFPLGMGGDILTDISRPKILDYFLSDVRVKSVPRVGDKIAFEEISWIEQKKGLAILTSIDVQRAFIDRYQGETQLQAIKVGENEDVYLFVEFPLQAVAAEGL